MTLPFWSLKNDKNRMNLQSKIFFLIRKYPWKYFGTAKAFQGQALTVGIGESFYNASQYLRYHLMKCKFPLHLSQLKLQYEQGVQCFLERSTVLKLDDRFIIMKELRDFQLHVD